MYEVKLAECDLVDPINYEIMKRYVVFLLKGVTLPHPNLISCKEHRAGASLRIMSSAFLACVGLLRQLYSMLPVLTASGPMGLSRRNPAGENSRLGYRLCIQLINNPTALDARCMQEWADVYGTRLKWLASYLCAIMHRTPFARTVCHRMVAASTVLMHACVQSAAGLRKSQH